MMKFLIGFSSLGILFFIWAIMVHFSEFLLSVTGISFGGWVPLTVIVVGVSYIVGSIITAVFKEEDET